MVKLAVLSVGYPNFRYDIAQQYLEESLVYLQGLQGVELVAETKVQIEEEGIINSCISLLAEKPDVFILQLGTYSYGNALMECIGNLAGTHVVYWAFREPILEDEPGLPLNSLCALNMVTSFLKVVGNTNFSYLYGDLQEDKLRRQLGQVIAGASIHSHMQKARLCVVEGRVPGFYRSSVDELRFRTQIGPEITYYSLAELIQDAEAWEDGPVQQGINRILATVAKCSGDPAALERSARVLLSLEEYARQNHIDGFALKCWPEFQSVYKIAPCAVVAVMNNSGFSVSCEGDITGLVSMMALQRLSDQPVFLTDLVNITVDGRVKFWHCGSAAPALAANPEDTCFGEHPTMRQGIGLGGSFSLKTGKVLVCKLSEDRPYKMFMVEGEGVVPDRTLTGNQIDTRLNANPEELLQLVVEEGIEHHYALAYNADGKALEAYCKIAGIRPVKPMVKGEQ